MEFKTVSKPENIEFSKQVIRIGTSIYRLKNVTSCEVREQPQELPGSYIFLIIVSCFLVSLIFVQAGELPPNFFVESILISAFLCGIIVVPVGAVVSLLYEASTPRIYVLILHLHAGEDKSFVYNDVVFLNDVVKKLYEVMDGSIENAMVNWQNRSIVINGNMSGVLSSGDSSTINSI
jgi:Family of unknown function (DUF6232)